LSDSQQEHLPELIQIKALPAMYDDSTHQLWHCDTVDGPMMLKVCQLDSVDKSDFWQGMKCLFDVDLPSSLKEMSQVYQKLSEYGCLAIPEHIASDSANPTAFILARLSPGVSVKLSSVDDDMVQLLARHISGLHSNRQITWGAFHQANNDARHWPTRLQQTLQTLSEQHLKSIPSKLLDAAMQQSMNMSMDYFVPIMPDLRWDQFLHQQGQLSTLVDLDAFVYGPRELELVLLEYLLDNQQAAVFMEIYQQTHEQPDLSQLRLPYRLLLFLMNVLGEQDLDKWMSADQRW